MTVIIGLVLLLFLVLLHEAGHFFASRICGVTVESFSVGMGPVLLHKKSRKGTDFRLSLIPLGGYCAMKGENDFRSAIEENLPKISSTPDSFYGTHPLKRLAIAFAGPFVNLLVGIFAFAAVAMAGYSYESAGTKIFVEQDILGEASPAYKAGLLDGDEIISIDETPMEDFSQVASYIGSKGDEEIKIKVKRGSDEVSVTVVPLLDKTSGAGKIGIRSDKNSVRIRQYPARSFFPALKEGCARSFSCLYMTLKGIRNLFKGVDITQAVSGPIRITTFMGSAVKEGFAQGVRHGFILTAELLAFISVSLFFTNMLPLGIFDGGLILIALIEWIRRKPIKPKNQLYIQYAGLAVVIFLMVFVIGGDILYLFKKH